MAMTAQTFPTYALLRGEDGVVKLGFGTRPTTPPNDVKDGCIFWDTDDHKLYHWTGSAWNDDIALGTITIASGDITLTDGHLTDDVESIEIKDLAGIKAAPENEGGRSIGQKVVNVLGSLAVLNAISGENVLCHNAQIPGTLTVNQFGGNYLAGPFLKDLTAATATTFVSIAVPSGSWRAVRIPYTLVADDGTDYTVNTGMLFVSVVNKGGTVSYKLNDQAVGADISSVADNAGGGPTVTFTAAEDVANTLAVKATGASSLTETTLRIYFKLDSDVPFGTITPA